MYLLYAKRPLAVRRSRTPLGGQTPPRPFGSLSVTHKRPIVQQQQQPILRRSMVIACAVKADALDPPTLREVVAEFLGDISEAARTIGTILQQAAR